MTEQEKRGKVIKGLECCMSWQPEGLGCDRVPCPYNDIEDCEGALHYDALALLKAQEARLVTEADFKNADAYGYMPAWCEEEASGQGYWEMILLGALDEKGVRYWTFRPTDAQREAIPWN